VVVVEKALSITTVDVNGTKTLVEHKLVTGGICGLVSIDSGGEGECSPRVSGAQGVRRSRWEWIVVVGVICILLAWWAAIKFLFYLVFCVRMVFVKHSLRGNHKILRC